MPERNPDASATPDNAPPKRRSLFGGLVTQLRQISRDVVSVAVGRLTEPPEESRTDETPGKDVQSLSASSSKRVRMLHDVAETMRGAADNFIAAKLDEIEARVDAKLDHVEERIDNKIVELHKQLREMRDRELRHRLRLLKITLIFTVLVALLSLGYKWVAANWVG